MFCSLLRRDFCFVEFVRTLLLRRHLCQLMGAIDYFEGLAMSRPRFPGLSLQGLQMQLLVPHKTTVVCVDGRVSFNQPRVACFKRI
jgi:hypothetical protein